MRYAQWVFDCDTPIAEFERRMRAALEARGWVTAPAQVYDFTCFRAGARAFVKVVYHDWGLQVAVKLKTGWFDLADAHLRALWDAGREAQVGALERWGARGPKP